MNISAIQTFLAVYRLRNLNRAAEELNITQSAVSARLDALEQALGARLLNRSRKGATLTKAGYAFLEQAGVIVRSWETARNRAAFPKGVTRLFSFVCDASLWSGLGRDLLAQWRTAHPDTAFEVWCAGRAEATEWLHAGLSDAALLADPIPGADSHNRPCATDVIRQVATRPRPVMEWDPSYVFVDYGQAFRDWHAETWPGDETGLLRFSHPDWALEHLLQEGGSAYLPWRLTRALEEDGRLHAIQDAPEFTRSLNLSWTAAADRDFPWLGQVTTAVSEAQQVS